MVRFLSVMVNITELLPGLVRYEYPKVRLQRRQTLSLTDLWPWKVTFPFWISSDVVDALVTENMMDKNGELCHQATEEATVAIGYVYSGEGCSIWYPIESYHCFAMLELYNSDTCTFFTPSGELPQNVWSVWTADGRNAIWRVHPWYRGILFQRRRLHKFMKLIGSYCAITTYVTRLLDWGLGASRKCHGQVTCFKI